MSINIEALTSLLIPALMLAVFVPAILTIDRLKRRHKDPAIERDVRPTWTVNAIQVTLAVAFSAYALGSFYFKPLLLNTGTHMPAGARNSPIEIKGAILYVTPGQSQWYAMSDWIHWIIFGAVFIAILLARRNNDA